MNIRRRLELLEKQLTSKPILLLMPDGRIEKLRGRRYHVLDLFRSACNGERTPELELIAQSVSSVEPGGGHMLDLVRGVLANPPKNGPEGDEPQDDEPQDDTPMNPGP